MSKYSDMEIVCKCGTPFIWTKGEQGFMQQLCDNGKIESVVPPKRCRECLKKKKLRHIQ